MTKRTIPAARGRLLLQGILLALASAACGSASSGGGDADATTDPGDTAVAAEAGPDASGDPGGDGTPSDALPGELPADGAGPDDGPEVEPWACAGCGAWCQELAVTAEVEGPTGSGKNDSFGGAEVVALGTEVAGHMGTRTDLDWFRFCVPEAGVVTLTLRFPEGFAKASYLVTTLQVQTDAWETSRLGPARSNKFGCLDNGVVKACTDSLEFRFSVTPDVGVYAFRVAVLDGQGPEAGFAYTVRADLVPGASLEEDQPDVGGQHVGEADTWKTATDLVFDGGDVGRAEVRTWAWNGADVDWFHFRPAADGRLWLGLDLLDYDALDKDAGKTIINVQADLLRRMPTGELAAVSTGGYTVEDKYFPTYLVASVSDRPVCPASVNLTNEADPVVGGADYFVRVQASSGYAVSAPYHLTVNLDAGLPESGEPAAEGVVGKTEQGYLVLPPASATTPVTARSWFWDLGDQDTFVVHAPADGAAQPLVATLDYTEAFAAHGGWDLAACKGPVDGLAITLGVAPVGGAALQTSMTPNVPTQQVAWTAEPGVDYELRILSQWAPDREHPYALTVKAP